MSHFLNSQRESIQYEFNYELNLNIYGAQYNFQYFFKKNFGEIQIHDHIQNAYRFIMLNFTESANHWYSSRRQSSSLTELTELEMADVNCHSKLFSVCNRKLWA